MTDAGMNEESAIPREAAWPQEVVKLVQIARKIHGKLAHPQACVTQFDESDLAEALVPFKEIGND